MWRLKQFLPRESSSLEGKIIDVGRHRLQVRTMIAQGGFSVVYLTKDSQNGRSYALKHIICSNEESLDLVMKEIQVMEVLKGHPNVVTLYEYHVGDNLAGKGKECFLLMDYCEKMLVNILDARSGTPIPEKDLLLQYRDICNALYAMHSQNPPIAHRDIKAENVLQQSDGTWRLCDFGSISTNHKVFTSPGEMGVEEDNIRKHTTPAYRAPEMWDLYRRELISEKVDIWAMGCLLYRMAYRKLPFDGDSKLQILNGNYRVPESSSYSAIVTELIQSMLQPKPEDRPTILQVWQRVNEGLPGECRLKGPDRPPSCAQPKPPLSRHSSEPGRETQGYGQSGGHGSGGHIQPRTLPQASARRASHDSGTVSASGGGGSRGGQFWSRHSTETQLSTPDTSASGQERASQQAAPRRESSNSGSSRGKDHWMDELSRNLSSAAIDNSSASWHSPDSQPGSQPGSNWASFDDNVSTRSSASASAASAASPPPVSRASYPEAHRGGAQVGGTIWASFGEDSPSPPLAHRGGGVRDAGPPPSAHSKRSSSGGGREAAMPQQNSYEAPQKSNVSRGSFWSQFPDAVQSPSRTREELPRHDVIKLGSRRVDPSGGEWTQFSAKSSAVDNGRKEELKTGSKWTAFT